MEFSFPFPFPKVGNAIFHSRSQSLGMGWAIPIPVPKCQKVIPAHPCQTPSRHPPDTPPPPPPDTPCNGMGNLKLSMTQPLTLSLTLTGASKCKEMQVYVYASKTLETQFLIIRNHLTEVQKVFFRQSIGYIFWSRKQSILCWFIKHFSLKYTRNSVEQFRLGHWQ